VLVVTAAVAAIIVIALLTYLVLPRTQPQASGPMTPSISATITALSSPTPPPVATTITITTTTLPRVNCGVDLHSPTVSRAVELVEPTAMYPLDPDNAWGNFDPCAELSVALVPTAMGTGSSPVEALMFHEGEYVDKATPTGVGYLGFNRDKTTEDTVVLIFRATTGSCGGCDDGTYDDVRFQWRNGRVVALDPIPRLMG